MQEAYQLVVKKSQDGALRHKKQCDKCEDSTPASWRPRTYQEHAPRPMVAQVCYEEITG